MSLCKHFCSLLHVNPSMISASIFPCCTSFWLDFCYIFNAVWPWLNFCKLSFLWPLINDHVLNCLQHCKLYFTVLWLCPFYFNKDLILVCKSLWPLCRDLTNLLTSARPCIYPNLILTVGAEDGGRLRAQLAGGETSWPHLYKKVMVKQYYFCRNHCATSP